MDGQMDGWMDGQLNNWIGEEGGEGVGKARAAQEGASVAQSLDPAPRGPSRPVFRAAQVSEWACLLPCGVQMHRGLHSACPGPPSNALPRAAPAGVAGPGCPGKVFWEPEEAVCPAPRPPAFPQGVFRGGPGSPGHPHGSY